MIRALVIGVTLSAATLLASPEERPARLDAGKVEVTLVLLDTVVTDRRGNPVAGLKIEDFDLLIDNVRSPIESLEEKCRPDSGVASHTAGADGLPEEPRYFILLFDMTHLKAVSRRDGINAAIRFLDEIMTDRDRTMVLAFKRGLHVVSRFSGDRILLKARLQELIENRDLTDSAAFEEENRLSQLARSIYHRIRRPASRATPFTLLERDHTTQFECEQEARSAEIDTTLAIRSFANTMPAFGAVQGRKAILFFTETLRADPGIPYYTVCGMSALARPSLGLTVQPEIQDLTRRANLAGVSFYPVHAAGMAGGPTDAGLRSSRDFETSIALATGGRNFVLMNDKLAPFRQAARDLSCHYVLAYRPPEGFATGNHVVKVFVRNKSLKVRYRESFTIQRHEEASDSLMLAVLSSPGIYRGLKVEGHVYSLAGVEGGKRRVLVKASVPLQELVLMPVAAAMGKGSLQVRGGVISPHAELACEFARSIPFMIPTGQDARGRSVGMEALCRLPEGEHEIVVAARDETGGALGTFWGKVQIRPPEGHTGPAALLWATAWPDIWERHNEESWNAAGPDGLFVRDSFTMRSTEPAALTLLACAGGTSTSTSRTSPEPAVVRLRGPRHVDLQAHEISGGPGGRCRLLQADIAEGTMSTGTFEVVAELSAPWVLTGASVKITVD